MKISKKKASPILIDERLRPFSHLPGTKMPLPFSEKGVQVFPAAIRMLPENKLIPLKISGPVKNFTCMLDLERGVIKVFGEAVSGYFRYYIFAEDEKVCFFQDRGNPVLTEDQSLVFADKLSPSKKFEKFSLGSNKTLDWELVKRRNQLEEILPVWFRVGQMFKCSFEHGSESLLQEMLISTGLPSKAAFLNFFQTGFSGVFQPEQVDNSYLGMTMPPLESNQNTLSGLVEGYNKIRSLMILEKESDCAILPEILLFFPHGKIAGIHTSFGEIDVEWTKNHIRQMVIHCKHPSKVHFSFPKTHKNCRLKTADLHLNLSLNCTLDLRADTRYFFSHFQE